MKIKNLFIQLGNNTFVFLMATFVLFLIITGGPKNVYASGNKVLPFEPGEKLLYHLKWNGLVAGQISLEVKPFEEKNGKQYYHFSMEGETTSIVAALVKYQIKIDSYTDSALTHSVYYQSSDIDRKFMETVKMMFNWKKNKLKYLSEKKRKKQKKNKKLNVSSKKKTISIPPDTFDVFASMYNLRHYLMKLEDETLIPVSATNGRKVLQGNVYVLGDEIIKHNGEKYNTKALMLDVKTLGNVFEVKEKKYLLSLWVSDDEYKIPLKVKGKVKFGSVTAELVSVERPNPESGEKPSE